MTDDLISRQALTAEIMRRGIYPPGVRHAIENAPAIDAVPVVRCKDCKHAEKSKYAFDWDGKTPLCECSYMTQPNRWHEYCSWAERKEAE